jgi:hypothetical protein
MISRYLKPYTLAVDKDPRLTGDLALAFSGHRHFGSCQSTLGLYMKLEGGEQIKFLGLHDC